MSPARKLLKIAGITFVTLAILAVAAAIYLQNGLAGFLESYVHSKYGLTLKIGAAELRFHPLSVRLESIELSTPAKGAFFTADAASASLPYSSFWRKEFVVQEITVDSPRIDLNRKPELATSRTAPREEPTPFRIEQVRITSAVLLVEDYEFRNISAEARVSQTGADVQKFHARFGDVEMNANGSMEWDTQELSFAYDARGDTASLHRFLPNTIPLTGPFAVSGKVEGAASRPVLTGQVEGAAFSVDGSAPFSASARFTYDFGNNTRPILVEADWGSLPLDLARRYAPAIPETSSVCGGTLRYTGGADLWNGDGSVTIQITANGATLPVAGELHGTLNGQSLQIDRGSLRLRSTSASISGTLQQKSMILNADLETTRAGDFTFLEPKLASVPGIYRARMELSGSYEDLRIQGRIQGRSEQTEMEAEGSYLLARESVVAQVRGTTTAKDLRAFIPQLQTGDIEFTGTLSGNSTNPEWTVHAGAKNLRAGDVGIGDVTVEAKGLGPRAHFRAEIPAMRLTTEGSYHWKTGVYEIHGRQDSTTLSELAAIFGKTALPVQGSIAADFEASGDLDQWKQSMAVIRLEETELRYEDAVIRLTQTEIRANEGAVTLQIGAQGPDTTMSIGGSVSLLKNYEMDLHARGTVGGSIVERIRKDWKGEGEIQIDTRIRGTPSRPKVEGTLDSSDLALHYLPQDLLIAVERLGVNFSPVGVQLDGAGRLNDSPVSWKGAIPIEKGPGNLHVEITNLPLRTFTENPKIGGALSASVDLRGEGFPADEWRPGALRQLPFHEWTGEILITPVGVKLDNNELSTEQPLRFAFQDRVLRLLPARITSKDLLNFQAEGGVNLDSGEIDGSLKLNARIDLLSSLQADIQSSGPLHVNMQFTGTLENPQYTGTVELTGASIRMPDSPVHLEDLSLMASIHKDRLILQKMQARSGGGTVTGEGEILFDGKGGRLSFHGENVAMLYPEGLRSQLDFDLNLETRGPDILLSGDIRVLRSFYDQQLTLRNPLIRKLMASRQELGAEKQFKNRIRLGLTIRTVQDFLMKNSLANLRGTADLKLEGSLYRPALTGEIGIREGSRLFLLGNQFDVEKAKITFYKSEAVLADLDVSLVALIQDSSSDTFYEVHLPFSGSTSHIEFRNVRSSPSLSEDQIFSLISQGTTDTEQTGSQRDLLQRRILMFFAGQALGSPAAAVAKSLGLSRIQVQQEGLTSVNDPKTRLVLGKDIGAGFALVYSFALNEPEDQTWIASYRYGRNVTARFIDQSDGTTTTSVNHRIQFGKGSGIETGIGGGRRAIKTLRISTIQITNSSSIPDEKIQESLGISTGERYDYWRFQDRAQKVKKQLQELGYLAPSVDVRETTEGTAVSLVVDVRPGNRGTMIFRGIGIGKKQLEHYRSVWRQGLSPVVVQQLIQEDILLQLRSKGHHQASVKTHVCEYALTVGEPPCPPAHSQGSEPVVDYLFDVTSGPQYRSVDLQFQGSGHYDPDSLQKDLQSLYGSATQVIVGAIHEVSSFEERVQALYLQHGYVRTDVTAGPAQYLVNEGRIVRKIQIDEGPVSKISSVKTGEGAALPDPLAPLLMLRPQQTFSPDGIVEDELRIRSYYEEEGYPDVTVAGELEFEKESPDIRVIWKTKMGPLARIAGIRVTGNQTTSSEFIRDLVRLKEGDVFTPHKRSLARKRLTGLGVFQQVTIEPEETENPGLYDVVVRVVENRRYEMEYGGRYNTDDKLGGEVRLSDTNFLGRAHDLALYARYSVDLPIYRLDYTLPVTGRIWDRTRLSFFHDVRDDDLSATVSGDRVEVPFEFTETTFQFQQDYHLSDAYRWIWGFDFGTNSATFTNFQTDLTAAFEGSIARLRSAWIVERRDDPLDARHGHFFSIEGEYAPTFAGTDISYQKVFSQFFLYRKFGPVTYAGGARVGFLKIRSNILTVSEKFRAGGSATVRGFGQNQLVPGDDVISLFFGGNSVFILNQELRFPIYKWFTAAAFYDGGNVYQLASDFDPLDLRHTAGFGIRAGAGGFLIRFDLGFNLDPQEDEDRHVFHFGIGQAF